MHFSRVFQKSASALVTVATSVSFLMQTTFAVYGQGLTPDTSAGGQHTPDITSAPNGVPLVNIATPNGSGLSHNKYLDFNVGPNGVIFNNSKVVGTSQLGGVLNGNPNLASGSAASVILNEVTSTNTSLLEGATEVFGNRADFILANPNGITCNGCGFLGTPRATLTTGTPELDPSSNALTGFSVNDGAISIGALGLDGSNVDYFDVISRSVAINGAIHGKDVSVITGRNDIDYANRVVKAVKADNGSAKPEFGIDSSALGGMYANRISLTGTEAGVGVRAPENMVAGSGGMVLTADGKLVLRKATSQGQIKATSRSSSVEVQDNLYAGTELDLEAATSLTVLEHVIAGARNSVSLKSGTTTELKGTLIAAGMDANGELLQNHGTLSIDSAGDLTSSSDQNLKAGQSLTVASAGNLSVSGKLASDVDLSLSSGGQLNTGADSLITTQSGDIIITAYDWANYGGVGAGRDLRVALSGTGTNAGIIGAKRDVTLALASDFENSDTLLAGRNIWIHGALATDRAGVITNNVGHIEAIDGNIDILSTAFMNVGIVPTVSSTQTSNTTTSLNHTSNAWRVYDIITTTVKTEALESSGEPAKLLAGGNLSIDADTISNRYSQIATNGDIVLTGNTLLNEGLEVVETTTRHHIWRYYKGSTHRGDSNKGTSSSSVTLASVPATISAGGSLTGSFTGRIDNNAIKENAGQVGLSSGDAVPSIVPDALEFTAPSSSLTIINPDPGAEYLYETRPEFVEIDKFYNSKYFQDQLPEFSPEITMKRLGDAYVETQLIRDQLLQQTGRRTLEGFDTDFETVQQLYNNALTAHGDLQLTPGISLTKEQIAALTTDIVWLEETIVNGQKVLVPKLYLAPGSRSTIMLAGSRIIGRDVKLEADEIRNEGFMVADASVELKAGTDLTNYGGSISGETVDLQAEETVANLSGQISGETVSIEAKDVRNETLTRRAQLEKGTFQTNQQHAEIFSTGDLFLSADNDIVSIGAEIGAGGNAALDAGRDIRLEALKTTAGFNMDSDVGTTRVDATEYQKGSVSVGGNLSLNAGRDIGIVANDIAAGGDADLSAGGDVTIASVQNRTRTEQTQAFSGERRHYIGDKSETVGSSLDAGGNLSITSGADVTVKASDVTAGGNIDVAASGDLTLEGDKAEQYEFYDSSSKRVLSKKSTLSEENGENYSGTFMIAGGNVNLTSGNDLEINGSTVIANDNVTLEGKNVELNAETTSASSSLTQKKSGLFAESMSGGLGFTVGYRKTKDQYNSESRTAHVSSVSGGNDLTIKAAEDITSEGGILAAGNDMTLEAGNDINLTSARDYAAQSESHELKQVGLSVGVFENVSGPVKTLIDTPRAATSGEGNLGYKALSGVSAGLRAVDAVNGLNAIKEGGTIGGVKIGLGIKSEESQSAQASDIARSGTLSAGNDLTMTAGRDITAEGTQIDAGNDVTIEAGRDVILEAAENTVAMDGSNSSMSAGIGLTLGVGLNGLNASVGVNASGQEGEYARSETYQTNTNITADNNLSITTGRDLALEGARAEAETADVTVGRDLTVVSQLDTVNGSNSSSGWNAGVSVGLGTNGAGLSVSGGVNGAQGSESGAWVNAPSGIITESDLNVSIEENTSLTGGVIASRSGEMTLETETLETQDLALHQDNSQISGGVNVNLGGNLNSGGAFTPGGSIEGSYFNSEKEGVAKATIGEGTVIVRDGDGDGKSAEKLRAEADAAEAAGDTETADALREEADAEAAEDTEATETQLANLNRDPDAVIEVTSEKTEGFELYISDTSLERAVQSIDVVGKALGQALSALSEELAASGDLTQSELDTAKTVAKAIDDGNINLQALVSCSGRRGFNFWDLIVSSAYATTGCVLFDENGHKIAELTPREREACVQMLSRILEKYTRDYLVGGSRDSELPSQITQTAQHLREIASDEHLLAGAQSLGMSVSLIRDVTFRLALGEENYAEFKNDWEKFTLAGELGAESVARTVERLAIEQGLSNQEVKDLSLVANVTTAAIVAAIGVKPKVPGRVQSRVNLAHGDSDSGWTHLLGRHFNPSKNASQFSISQSDLRNVLQSPQVVNTPITRTLESTRHGTLYLREVDLGRSIGVDKFNDFRPTTTITVMTDRFGNLVTATPGIVR